MQPCSSSCSSRAAAAFAHVQVGWNRSPRSLNTGWSVKTRAAAILNFKLPPEWKTPDPNAPKYTETTMTTNCVGLPNSLSGGASGRRQHTPCHKEATDASEPWLSTLTGRFSLGQISQRVSSLRDLRASAGLRAQACSGSHTSPA